MRLTLLHVDDALESQLDFIRACKNADAPSEMGCRRRKRHTPTGKTAKLDDFRKALVKQLNSAESGRCSHHQHLPRAGFSRERESGRRRRMKDYSFYWEGTSGKGVLLVHGLTGAPMEMKFIGKQLHKRGFTVYAPTLPGHCQDERSLLRTRFEDWLGGLRESLHLFRKKVKEVHAAGICVGGGLALYLAYSEPTLLKKVVIYSATLNYDGWNVPFYYRWAPYGIPLLVKLPFLKRLGFSETAPYGIKSERVRAAVMRNGLAIEGALPSFPMGALYENYRLNKALEKALPLIRTPTLLIHAKEDDVSHPRNADRIQKLHGGRCELVLLDDSYHMLHIDQERHKVADLTADFFERNNA